MSLAKPAFLADLGGSSKYSNENFVSQNNKEFCK